MAEFSLVIYGEASGLDRLLKRWTPTLEAEREDVDVPPAHSFLWYYPDLEGPADAQLGSLLNAIEDPIFELFRTYSMRCGINIYVGSEDAITIRKDLLLKLGVLRVDLAINGVPMEDDEQRD